MSIEGTEGHPRQKDEQHKETIARILRALQLEGQPDSSSTQSDQRDLLLDSIDMDNITLEPVTQQVPYDKVELTTVGIYAVQVEEARDCRHIFEFVSRLKLEDKSIGHLKRVKREGEKSLVMICAAGLISLDDLQREIDSDTELGKNRLQLKVLETVAPAHAAYTRQQHKEWNEVWPVNYLPPRSGPRRLEMGEESEDLVDVGGQQNYSAWKKWVVYHLLGVIAYSHTAEQNGEIASACRVVERSAADRDMGTVVSQTHDTRSMTQNPLSHAVMNAIDASKTDYLLTQHHVFLTHEPCIMCTMALVHSRVASVYFVQPSSGGGLCMGLHEKESLNHKFRSWKASGIATLVSLNKDV